MSKNDVISLQREANDLIGQFQRLPKASQRQVVDRVSHIIAVAIVGQIGVAANTAAYLDEAGKALSMVGS